MRQTIQERHLQGLLYHYSIPAYGLKQKEGPYSRLTQHRCVTCSFCSTPLGLPSVGNCICRPSHDSKSPNLCEAQHPQPPLLPISAVGLIDVVSMFSVNTNDAFVGIDTMRLEKKSSTTVYPPAYDAGKRVQAMVQKHGVELGWVRIGWVGLGWRSLRWIL